jgi:hypothetical protein
VRERKGACRVWWGIMKGSDNLEDLGVDGRIPLTCVNKWSDVKCSDIE